MHIDGPFNSNVLVWTLNLYYTGLKGWTCIVDNIDYGTISPPCLLFVSMDNGNEERVTSARLLLLFCNIHTHLCVCIGVCSRDGGLRGL